MKVLLVALVAGLALVAPPAAAEDPPATAVAQIEGVGFAPDDVGYLVVDLKTGKTLAEYNADQPFIPASVAKIPPMAAALEILGADHRFETTLLVKGDVEDGTLTGTLVLRGGGDPFLSGDELQLMAKALVEAGISAIDGDFLYDASALIEAPYINPRQPEAAGYNTGVSALSVNFNRVRLNWEKGSAEPSAGVNAVSEGVTQPIDAIGLAFAEEAPPGPFIRAHTPVDDLWLLSPELEPRGEDWLPVGNPSLITAEIFRAFAATEGVELPEPKPGIAPDGARVVVSHESLPLAEIVRGVMRYSNNLSAELVGLAATRAVTDRRRSLQGSAETITAWWRSRLADADWAGFAIENHSGLSSTSRATPRQIVEILEDVVGSIGDDDFHGLLPEISWKGVEGSARVKTGTIAYARGLAGYIDTARGNRLAFAIFIDDKEKRAALDAAFDPRVRTIDPASQPWRRGALSLEQDLTTDWAERF
ncbi:D-alanyl-D-alanine carboxypeptidase/D-alanyl-D-alanine endopeptidase [Bauldia sp.]|uniref:D-alanyl-D-alanine carboxypeptidase/D-alanyl-D-alanine endopeptidase n=1 Tax=Bauldia sp. TaxID=2575872 RepID=UPI003BAAB012